MRVVIQKVSYASVAVEQKIIGEIQSGYVLLVGITHDDNEAIVQKMAKKIVELRINDDEDGKLNLSLQDVRGEILSISQFTLYADCKKGRRPSFDMAAPPQSANILYELFNDCLRSANVEVQTGKFRAEMKVTIINEGPITIILDSQNL